MGAVPETRAAAALAEWLRRSPRLEFRQPLPRNFLSEAALEAPRMPHPVAAAVEVGTAAVGTAVVVVAPGRSKNLAPAGPLPLLPLVAVAVQLRRRGRALFADDPPPPARGQV